MLCEQLIHAHSQERREPPSFLFNIKDIDISSINPITKIWDWLLTNKDYTLLALMTNLIKEAHISGKDKTPIQCWFCRNWIKPGWAPAGAKYSSTEQHVVCSLVIQADCRVSQPQSKLQLKNQEVHWLVRQQSDPPGDAIIGDIGALNEHLPPSDMGTYHFFASNIRGLILDNDEKWPTCCSVCGLLCISPFFGATGKQSTSSHTNSNWSAWTYSACLQPMRVLISMNKSLSQLPRVGTH